MTLNLNKIETKMKTMWFVLRDYASNQVGKIKKKRFFLEKYNFKLNKTFILQCSGSLKNTWVIDILFRKTFSI